MSSSDGDGEDAMGARVAAVIREAMEPDAAREDAALARGEARFLRSQAAGAVEKKRRAPWAIAVVAAGLAAAALVLVLRPSSPIAFRVAGRAAASSGYVRAPLGAAPVDIVFSEGTKIVLAAGGALRVDGASAHGARVLLEDGAAHLRVNHLPGAAWQVEAGPFTVDVKGTEFDVAWSSDRQDFSVTMQSGEVVVRGPLASEGVALRGGEKLVARLPEGELRVTGAVEAAPAVSAPPPATATVAIIERGPPVIVAPSRPAPRPEPPAGDRAAEPPWSSRVAHGDFRGVLASAGERGVDDTLATAPLTDLVALADAARYGKQPDLARRALLAQRGRFAGTPEAATAAFLLGRNAEDVDGDAAAAIRDYDAYLHEAPDGPLASEALGRKMMLLRRQGRDEDAARAADEYVRRFPGGAYAGSAAKVRDGG